MFLVRGMYILFIFLLIAGCTHSETVQETSRPVPQLKITKVTPIPNYAVTVNPFGDHYVGDSIKINGTIKCDVDEVLIFIIAPKLHTCLNKNTPEGPCFCCKGVSIVTPVIRGIDGNNTWSMELNTSEHRFYPDNFQLSVLNQSCDESYAGYVFLNLTTSPNQNLSLPANGTLNSG